MTMEYFEGLYWPLIAALQERGVLIIIGGGMALYLRDLHLDPRGRSVDYPPRPTTRTTKGLDAFLSQDLIGDATLFYKIPAVLHENGFTPIERNKYWQYGALPDESGYYAVMVDLLGARPDDHTLLHQPNDERRVRPKPSTGSAPAHIAHARHIDQAAGIHHHPRQLNLGDGRSLHIASSLNLLILKLGALSERLKDEQLAQKHAFDLLKVVSDMSAEDWADAVAQLGVDYNAEYMRAACDARLSLFDAAESPRLPRHALPP